MSIVKLVSTISLKPHERPVYSCIVCKIVKVWSWQEIIHSYSQVPIWINLILHYNIGEMRLFPLHNNKFGDQQFFTHHIISNVRKSTLQRNFHYLNPTPPLPKLVNVKFIGIFAELFQFTGLEFWKTFHNLFCRSRFLFLCNIYICIVRIKTIGIISIETNANRKVWIVYNLCLLTI